MVGREPFNKKSVDASEEKVKSLLEYLNGQLENRTFLVGERLTLADLVMVGHASRGMGGMFDPEFRKPYPNFIRYYSMVHNQEIFKKVAGEPQFITERIKFTPPKTEKAAKDTKAAAAPKKAAAKEADDEEEEKPKEKVKHPLEGLPAAAMVMDEWKRTYSNNETPDAMKWFWEHADFNGYSLWKVDYKYNDELGMVFMSSNLCGGFFQRLEASRKFLFGSLCVYGVNSDSVIEGVFLVRGQDALPAFDVAPDHGMIPIYMVNTNKFYRKLRLY